MELSSGCNVTDEISDSEWETAWRARTDRQLPRVCKFDLPVTLGLAGELVSVTISAAPTAFAERVWCQSDNCPVCGCSTVGLSRTKVALDIQWAEGFGCFVGAWAHDGCLVGCPVIGPAVHIPW